MKTSYKNKVKAWAAWELTVVVVIVLFCIFA